MVVPLRSWKVLVPIVHRAHQNRNHRRLRLRTLR